ncbi:hypothetical protein [Nonomuraea sp. NPDC050691]|uniref:hypothetical protein n=1 Tax=Nonomuraea sp. NPDC050691 TaxID=3155661 RepID=UPI003403BB34
MRNECRLSAAAAAAAAAAWCWYWMVACGAADLGLVVVLVRGSWCAGLGLVVLGYWLGGVRFRLSAMIPPLFHLPFELFCRAALEEVEGP